VSEGIEFQTGVVIGKDITTDQLLDDFDAIVLCLGSTWPRDLNIPGRHTGVTQTGLVHPGICSYGTMLHATCTSVYNSVLTVQFLHPWLAAWCSGYRRWSDAEPG